MWRPVEQRWESARCERAPSLRHSRTSPARHILQPGQGPKAPSSLTSPAAGANSRHSLCELRGVNTPKGEALSPSLSVNYTSRC